MPVAHLVVLALLPALQESTYPDPPAGPPPLAPIEDAVANSASTMRAYTEAITGTDVTFGMLAIRGGSFRMGSPASEKQRKEEELLHTALVSPFWIGSHEVTWNEYHLFMLKLDVEERARGNADAVPQDAWADAVSRPTPPYVPMDFEMGTDGFPAVCMTQFAAKQYTKWLSMKTGRFYRLPTEAEWEYACRAGTSTAYSFGDDAKALPEHAWFFDNADDRYHAVGSKLPNPWGLFDMHGNVAEWVLDRHDKDDYASSPERDPIAWPTGLYPRVVRGGSWDDDARDLRSAARRGSRKGWKVQDPQLPKSIWYHTDASFVGFRVVRPLVEPSEKDKAAFWEAGIASIERVQQRQRNGER